VVCLRAVCRHPTNGQGGEPDGRVDGRDPCEQVPSEAPAGEALPREFTWCLGKCKHLVIGGGGGEGVGGVRMNVRVSQCEGESDG
jgi:hypothetical protein